MSEAVYRDYDSEALYAQYNNRAQVTEDELNAIKANQNARSKAYIEEAKRKYIDVAYGPHPRERVDIFLPEQDNAPLFAFIHGGYWQWNGKEGFEFLAKELNAAGAAFANIEYELCPAVTMEELADQCRRAIAYLWREAAQYGYNPSHIVVSGHSAGGHLTSLMQATDWPAFEDGLPSDIVAAGLPISGIYDLEAIRLTPLNDPLGMKPEDVGPLSPMFLEPLTRSPSIIAFGGAEYDEFDRQAEDMAKAWAAKGMETSTLNLPGRDHFTALSALAETDHALFAAALKLLGLR